MKLFWTKYQIQIIIAVIIIITVLTIYFLGKRSGKKNSVGPQAEYSNGGDEWSPIPLAKELYDVMDGVVFDSGASKAEAWDKLTNLPTDNMVIDVYNAFNKLYYSQGDGTLVEWIMDENFWGDAKDNVLARLRKLNLQ